MECSLGIRPTVVEEEFVGVVVHWRLLSEAEGVGLGKHGRLFAIFRLWQLPPFNRMHYVAMQIMPSAIHDPCKVCYITFYDSFPSFPCSQGKYNPCCSSNNLAVIIVILLIVNVAISILP